uniref:Uncharacterized protein n=1 Tax=Branchiostoma floridae TaxID=7739 RepID=C3Y2G3_BRAFL|eukprot:XP_002609508.1 hypothetical protein BRAFLDRAFT_95601 [Branchiostoma floridae]
MTLASESSSASLCLHSHSVRPLPPCRQTDVPSIVITPAPSYGKGGPDPDISLIPSQFGKQTLLRTNCSQFLLEKRGVLPTNVTTTPTSSPPPHPLHFPPTCAPPAEFLFRRNDIEPAHV